MKNWIIGLLTLAALPASAGTLENRNTGESVSFKLNEVSRYLTITSTAREIENRIVPLLEVKRKKSTVRLFAGTAGFVEMAVEVENGGVWLFLPPVVAYDLLAMPIKASVKLIQNARHKKDYASLMQAITSSERIVVSDARFQRVAALLKTAE